MIHKRIMDAMELIDKAIASGLSKEEYCEKNGISIEVIDNAIETINSYWTEQKKPRQLYDAYSSLKNIIIADIQVTYGGIVINFPKGTSKAMFDDFCNYLKLVEMNNA